MAVMSPQTSATNPEHKQTISTPLSTITDNVQAEEATAMDLDVNGTNKEESTTAFQETIPQSSPLEAARNPVTSPVVNGSSKGIAAPPSPPIPTPPLHLSIDGTEHLSDLHITSPPGNVASMDIKSSPIVNPKDAISPGTKMDMDDEPISPLTTTATLPNLPQQITPDDKMRSRPPKPPTISTDHEMLDAPPSLKTARDREEDDDDAGRPAKRAKTDEIDDEPPSGDQVQASASTTTGVAEGVMPKVQQKYALQVLRTVRRTKDSGPFQTPVDPVKLNIPTYFDYVSHPMDLSTMEKKLSSEQYANVDAFTADFKQIIANCVLFNGLEHKVTEMAHRIEATFERQMKNMPPPDQPEPPEKKSHKKGANSRGGSAKATASTAKAPSKSPAPAAEAPLPTPPPPPPPPPPAKVPAKTAKAAKGPSRKDSKASTTSAASPTFAVGPSGIPQIRRESTSQGDGRPKREIHPPPPRDLPYTDIKPRRKKTATELKFCDNVIKEVMKKQYEAFAFPFYTPVDPVALNIPDYFKIIKKPMDLSTIQGKLKTNQYDSANEFESDIKLMLANCYKFNPAGSPVNTMGKKFEELFNKKWAEKTAFIQSQSGSRSPVSASPPPEEEEELSEDEVVNDDIALLEQQLEAVKNQLTRMKKSKSKSAATPAVTKKSKSGGAGARKSSVSMHAAAAKKGGKKGGTKKQAEQFEHITLEQKLELSQRINLLPPTKMLYAMQLIQQNMPSLLGDDEIELDIDELPAPILYKLHQYVSKHAPPVVKAEQEDEYVLPPAPTPAPKKAAPRPKKNKPMSAIEQETKIKNLRDKLQSFDNPDTAKASAPVAVPADSGSESSDDDESSGSESEEE